MNRKIINEWMSIQRVMVLKRKFHGLSAADNQSVIERDRRQRVYDNHVACQTEHLWYIARATEQIAEGRFKKEHPTSSGRKE